MPPHLFYNYYFLGGGGGDVVACHKTLPNAILDICKRALLKPKLGAGPTLGQERRPRRPADVTIQLVLVWVRKGGLEGLPMLPLSWS